MTPSELKFHVEQGSDSHFFDRGNMKFFGDRMSNYGVRSAKLRSNYDAEGNWTDGAGVVIDVWELYRKRPVKHGLQRSAYFRKTTFSQAYGEPVE